MEPPWEPQPPRDDTESRVPEGRTLEDFRTTTISLELWNAVYQSLREKDISSASLLRRYQAGSAEVYGEINPSFVERIIQEVGINNTDLVLDIGSGIGNVIMQICARTGCHGIGVEIRKDLADIATAMLHHLPSELYSQTKDAYGLLIGRAMIDRMALAQGDASSDAVVNLNSMSVVVMNNLCFPPELEVALLRKFVRELRKGAVLVCTRDIAPRFRPGPRYETDPRAIFEYPWQVLKAPVHGVSWSAVAIPYYIYKVGLRLDERQKILEAF